MSLSMCGSVWLRMEFETGKNLAPRQNRKPPHSRVARGLGDTAEGYGLPPLLYPVHSPGSSNPSVRTDLLYATSVRPPAPASHCETLADQFTPCAGVLSGFPSLGSWVWVQGRHRVTEVLFLLSSPQNPSLPTQPKGTQGSGPRYTWAWACSPGSLQHTLALGCSRGASALRLEWPGAESPRPGCQRVSLYSGWTTSEVLDSQPWAAERSWKAEEDTPVPCSPRSHCCHL